MSTADFVKRGRQIVKRLSCFPEIVVDINKYAALIDVLEAGEKRLKSGHHPRCEATTECICGHDALAAAINKATEG